MLYRQFCLPIAWRQLKREADGQGQGWPSSEKKEMVSPGSKGSSNRVLRVRREMPGLQLLINSLPGWEQGSTPMESINTEKLKAPQRRETKVYMRGT